MKLDNVGSCRVKNYFMFCYSNLHLFYSQSYAVYKIFVQPFWKTITPVIRQYLDCKSRKRKYEIKVNITRQSFINGMTSRCLCSCLSVHIDHESSCFCRCYFMLSMLNIFTLYSMIYRQNKIKKNIYKVNKFTTKFVWRRD